MTESNAVLFANEAFYAAFAGGDYDAMTQAWSDDEHLTCIHPGWAPLTGRKAVLESWGNILSGAEPLDIRCLEPQARILGGSAYVVGYEQVEDNILSATNVFIQQGRLWRMVHHQAGPCHNAPTPNPAEEEKLFQ